LRYDGSGQIHMGADRGVANFGRHLRHEFRAEGIKLCFE